MKRLGRVISIGKSILLKKPHIILADLTYKCNFNCAFCHADKKKRPVMGLEEWKDIIDQIKKWPGCVFIDFSGGEPLLNKDCIEVLEYSKKQGLITGLSTNASLIDRKTAEKLIKLNLYTIYISIQGTKATHRNITGTGSYEKTISGAKNLIRAKKKAKVGTKIYARAIIHKQNIHEIEEITKIVKELGLDGIIYRPLSHSEQLMAGYRKKDMWINDEKKLKEIIEKIKAEKGIKILNSHENLDLIYDYYMNDFGLEKSGKPPCRTAFKALKISCDGTVKNCCLTLGNIKRSSLKGLYQQNLKRITAQSRKCKAKGITGYKEPSTIKAKIAKSFEILID